MDKKQAHLQMIQGVVNRLSQNSFLLKGWSVVLVSALFALAAGDRKLYFIYLAYFPAVSFWLLDGYFLLQERLFRALYDHVRQLTEDEVDFSMDTSIVKSRVSPWLDVVLSRTLYGFHGTLFGSIVVVMLLATYFGRGGQ